MGAKKQQVDLDQGITHFKQQNPKVAEAMQLFNLTLAQYQAALNALNGPRVYQSASTSTEKRPTDGQLD